MKKYIIGLLVFWSVLAAVIFVTARFYLDPKLKEILSVKLAESLEAQVSLDSVKTHFIPLSLSIYKLKIDKPAVRPQLGYSLTLDEVRVGLAPYKALVKVLSIQINLIKPNVEFIIPKPLTEARVQKQGEALSMGFNTERLADFKSKYDLEVDFGVQSGRFNFQSPSQKVDLSDINVHLLIPGLDKNWTLKYGSDVYLDNYKLKLPVYLDAKLKIDGENLKIEQSQINVSGIDIGINGFLNLVNWSQSWSIGSKIPQIEALNTPIDTGCLKLKKGALDVVLKAQGAQGFQNISAEGIVKVVNLNLNTDCEFLELKSKGPATLNFDVAFKYGKALSFDHVKAQGDLSQLDLKYQSVFQKRKNLDFRFNIDSTSAGGKWYLKSADMKLLNIRAQAKGVLSYEKGVNSEFEVLLPKTSLRGAEELFPVIANQPLEGDVELNAKVNGDLTQPGLLSVSLSPFVLQNFKAAFNWQNEDKTMNLSGPVYANVNATIKSKGSLLENASVLANVELKSFQIKSPFFIKNANQPLNLVLNADHKKNQIVFKNSNINLAGSFVQIEGSITSPSRPTLNLQLKTKGFQIDPLIKMMPKFSTYKVNGTASGQVAINGIYDFKTGIDKSPLASSGNLNFLIKEVVLPKVNEEKKETNAGANANEIISAEPFLPAWPLYKQSKFKISSQVSKLVYGDLTVGGIKTIHTYNAGEVQSSGVISSIFDGKVNLKASKIHLLEKAPTTTFSGMALEIKLEKVMSWVSQEWKDLLKGRASGNFYFSIPHPTRKDFVSKTTGKGVFLIKNGFLSTLAFDQIVNEKLSKIPGIGESSNLKLNTKGASGNIKAKFEIRDSKLNLEQFNIVTPERNELEASGWVAFDKSFEMNSQIFLTNAPIKGSVREANSDSIGRFTMPVKLNGNIFSPNVDIAGSTAKILLEKTAKLEADKLQKKVSLEAQKKGKELTDKLKKDAENKLKGLFKK